MSNDKLSRKNQNQSLPLKQVEEELVAINPTIFKGLDSNKKAEVIKTFSYAVKVHSGPLPPADMMREYEDIYPGSAKLILDTFSDQSKHRMKMEDTVITSQQKQSGRGQNYAFIIAVLFLLAAVGCIFTEHEVSGTIIGSVDLVALVTVFIMGKKGQKENLEKKAPK